MHANLKGSLPFRLSALLAAFYFFAGIWKEWEAKAFSINILELAVQNMGCFTFAALSRALGNPSTHVLTFGDNTCAEMVSERGRTQSPGMGWVARALAGSQRACGHT